MNRGGPQKPNGKLEPPPTPNSLILIPLKGGDWWGGRVAFVFSTLSHIGKKQSRGYWFNHAEALEAFEWFGPLEEELEEEEPKDPCNGPKDPGSPSGMF